MGGGVQLYFTSISQPPIFHHLATQLESDFDSNPLSIAPTRVVIVNGGCWFLLYLYSSTPYPTYAVDVATSLGDENILASHRVCHCQHTDGVRIRQMITS